MQKLNKKISLSVILSIFVISMLAMNISSVNAAVLDQNVAKNDYKGTIAGNESNQFTFRNRFRFQVRTNQSTELDMDVDVDAVGDRDFALELNTSNAGENMKLTIQVKAENDDLGLTKGKQIKNQNQYKYQYKEQFMVNLSLDQECELQAKLKLKTQDKNASWAYYDEEAEEFVLVESEYIDGEVVATTEHFSIWTVITPESDSLGLPGYSMIGGFIGIGIVGSIIVYKKRN